MTQYAKASAFGGGGSASVITTRGDIIRGDSSGDNERLALGASGYVLTSDGTDAAWVASATGAGSMPAATYVDNTGGVTVTGTSYNTIVIDTTEIEDSGFSNASGVVTIPTTGRYRISASIILDIADSYVPVNAVLQIWKNGTTSAAVQDAGELCNLAEFSGPLTAAYIDYVLDLTASDTIQIRFKEDPANGVSAITTATGSTLRIVKLTGTTGATGATGADGDMTWEGTWATGNYTANQAVHYAVDGNAYVCKLNTVSNEVPTNATYWDVLALAGSDGAPGTSLWATTTAKSAAFTAVKENLYLVDSSGGTIAITMPASPSDGDVFRVKDSTGNFGTNNVTLTRAASESIEGIAANKILQTNWGSYTIVSDGTNWFLING